MLQVVRLALLLLYFLGLLVLFFFHTDLVIPYTLNCLLQIINLGVLGRVVAIFLVQFCNKLPQLKLLSLDEDVVALEVLVLLLCKHQVEPIIKRSNSFLNLPILIVDLRVKQLLVALSSSARGLARTSSAQLGWTAGYQVNLKCSLVLVSRDLARILRVLAHRAVCCWLFLNSNMNSCFSLFYFITYNF